MGSVDCKINVLGEYMPRPGRDVWVCGGQTRSELYKSGFGDFGWPDWEEYEPIPVDNWSFDVWGGEVLNDKDCFIEARMKFIETDAGMCIRSFASLLAHMKSQPRWLPHVRYEPERRLMSSYVDDCGA